MGRAQFVGASLGKPFLALSFLGRRALLVWGSSPIFLGWVGGRGDEGNDRIMTSCVDTGACKRSAVEIGGCHYRGATFVCAIQCLRPVTKTTRR